eukprot:5848-Heterococcus_DN1.PRE.3
MTASKRSQCAAMDVQIEYLTDWHKSELPANYQQAAVLARATAVDRCMIAAAQYAPVLARYTCHC